MAFKESFDNLVDKLTTGEKMKYIMTGTLILIIAVSLVSVFFNFSNPNRNTPIKDVHYFCLETQKEFILKPEDMVGPQGMPGPDMMGPIGILVVSPYTNERTAVPMTRCPNCKKWFVPEYLENALEKGEEAMMMQPHGGNLVCPHCQTDIMQWYRDKRKKK